MHNDINAYVVGLYGRALNGDNSGLKFYKICYLLTVLRFEPINIIYCNIHITIIYHFIFDLHHVLFGLICS